MPELKLATEYPPVNEQRHIDSLIAQLRAKMERDYAKGRTLRDAHPKMHGCVRAEFTVDANLPPELAVGVFSRGRGFPAWVRFSNASGDVKPDSKPDIRGVAFKLMGVEGPKLLEGETDGTTQDFILISASRFVTRDVAEFDGLVKALVGGFPAVVFYFVPHFRVLLNLVRLAGRFTNPLAIRYFSVAPYLLGSRAVKYSLTPRGAPPAVDRKQDSGNFLREAMAQQLSASDAVFDFSIQLQTDPYKMPIEDPSVNWDESLAPFQRVATLTIPAQVFDTPSRDEMGDNLSFNPWRTLAEHRPMGGISRARRQVYRALSKFRHERNQAPHAEPSI